MKKKVMILSLIAALCLTACSQSAGARTVNSAEVKTTMAAADSFAMEAADYGMAEYDMLPESAPEQPVDEYVNVNAEEGRKLIHTVQANISSENYHGTKSCIEQSIRSAGGYIESMNEDKRTIKEKELRTLTMTIRIPDKNLDAFIGKAFADAKIESMSRSAEDVTLRYSDLDTQRKVYETEEKRLLEYLAKAENVKEMLDIEDRISDVRYKLEKIETQLKGLDNRISCASVYLTLNEVPAEEVVEPEPDPSYLQRLGRAFTSSMKGVGTMFKELSILFVAALPYLVIIGFIVFAVYYVNRKKKTGEKKQESENKVQPPAA